MYCCGASGDYMEMLVAGWLVAWSIGSYNMVMVDSDVWLHDAKEELTFKLDYNQSCPCSYFCIVGWGPGGYSGIQEVGLRSRQES